MDKQIKITRSKPIDIIKKASPPIKAFHINEMSDISLDDKILDDKKSDMSFSMIIDNKKELGCTPPEKDFILTKINTIYPKGTGKWIDSNLIYSCQGCSSVFGMFNRKHHCRACGGVFCSYCCNKTITIPNNFIKKPKEDDTVSQKISNTLKWFITGKVDLVCNECFNKITNLKKITYIIKICEYLDYESLCVILYVSKNWHNSGIHQLSKFREIQYSCPTSLFPNWKMNMMWLSRNLFVGHHNWIIILVKSSMQLYYNNKDEKMVKYVNEKEDIFGELKKLIHDNNKKLSCWKLMCSRKCNVKYDILDFVELLRFVTILESKQPLLWTDENIQEILLLFLKKIIIIEISNEETNELNEKIKCVIPLICYVFTILMNVEPKRINYDFVSKIFIEFLKIKNCIVDFVMEVNYLDKIMYKNIGIINFIKFFNDFFKKNIDVGSSWMKDIDEMIYFFVNLNKVCEIKKPIIYPLDLNYRVIKINSVEKIESNTSPYIISVDIVPTVGSFEVKTVKFLIKKDDGLRKERIVACLIKLLQDKLYKQAQKKRIKMFEKIPTYQIIMLTHNIGIIEFVENSKTLRMVNKKGLTLQNYILDLNKEEPTEITKRRFMQSLAISCCISYILGLGDRHLDNIMINGKGQIFHIDYGYLMENPMTSILTAPNIKVTTVMIDFLGGPEGIFYKEFTEYIIQIYDIMRLYKNIIINYYEMLGNEKFVDWTTFRDKLESRFMTGMMWKDIQITLINEIETSNSYRSEFGDFCHSAKHALFDYLSKKS